MLPKRYLRVLGSKKMNFLKNQSVIFCIFVLFGLLISFLSIHLFSTNLTQIDYSYFSYTLLAIWLYGWVYGINIWEFSENKKVIFSAVTIWVVLKSIIIGWLLFFVTGNILSFLLWVVVAQIDPVSVWHLLKWWKSKRLSQKWVQKNLEKNIFSEICLN